MKGLLLKDLGLLKGQIRFFITVIVLSLFIAIPMNNPSFMVSFTGMVIPMFALSTISYDEFDNGNAFLFTLPIDRREYIFEKYVFALILGIATLAFSSLAAFIASLSSGWETGFDTLIAAPIVLVLMLITLSFMIPVQLKFGAEKSKIALIMIFAVLGALGFAIIKILEGFNINIMELMNTVINGGLIKLTSIAAAAVLLMLFISIKISIAIINKKEF